MAWTPPSDFNPTTGINVLRLLDGDSLASAQNPSGLGIAQAIQVEFGPALLTVNDPVQLFSNGTLKFNVAGTYRIKISLQFGRIGQSQTSLLLFRVTDAAGNQIGRSIAAQFDDSTTDLYIENDTWLFATAGLELKFELMRDNNGHNSGGLIMTTPDDEGVNTWNNAPSAAIRVEQWV